MIERRTVTSQTGFDRTELQFNKFCMAGMLVLAMALSSRPLVLLVLLIQGIGTVFPGRVLFAILYHRFLRRTGLLIARFVEGDVAPELFTQGLEATLLAVALFLLFASSSPVGWALTGLIALSATLELLFGLSFGRALYRRLARWGFIDGQFQHQRQTRLHRQRGGRQAHVLPE